VFDGSVVVEEVAVVLSVVLLRSKVGYSGIVVCQGKYFISCSSRTANFVHDNRGWLRKKAVIHVFLMVVLCVIMIH